MGSDTVFAADGVPGTPQKATEKAVSDGINPFEINDGTRGTHPESLSVPSFPLQINDGTPGTRGTPTLHKVESQCGDVFRMLAQMQSDGLKLSVENGMINPTGKRQVIGKWLPEITRHRAALIEALNHPAPEPEPVAVPATGVAWHWLVYLPGGEVREVFCVPECDRAEVLGTYPAALDAKPGNLN